MLGDIGLDAETACLRIHLDFSDCVHITGQMLPFRVSVVPASSQPAVSTSPGLEGDVSLRRYLYVIVVLSNATNMFRRFERMTEEPTA